MLPVWFVEEVKKRERFIAYLESRRSMEFKVRRARNFYGVKTPEELFQALRAEWGMDGDKRSELISYVLTELMHLKGDDYTKKMEEVPDGLTSLAEAVRELTQY